MRPLSLRLLRSRRLALLLLILVAVLLIGYQRWLVPDDAVARRNKPRILAAISLIPTLPMSLIAGAAIPGAPAARRRATGRADDVGFLSHFRS